MSCMWCARFYREYDADHRLTGRDYLDAMGECTLNPVRTPVSGAHVCGSFVWERIAGYNDGLTAIASRWLRDSERTQEQKDLRKEVRRLKEANRLLREKLKQKA